MTKNTKYLLSALILSCFGFWGINTFQNNFDNYLTAQISIPLGDRIFFAREEAPKSPAPELEAAAALSAKIAPGRSEKIFLQKNIEEPLPIASLTKLMTALVVFEDPITFDFSKIVTISKVAAGQGNTPHYGNLTAGENYTLGKLVELMMVYSSNDAAYAISEIIGPDDFVTRMNKTALSLDMNYTYFLNPSGLDPRGVANPPLSSLNYSTAADLLKLSQYILKNYPEIFELTLQGYNFDIENGISSLELYEDQSAIGGKTGYTKNAKGNLLFAFKDDRGNIYINIVLGAENDLSRIQEMQKIINWLSLQ